MTLELQPARRRGRLGVDRGLVVLVAVLATIAIGVIKPWGQDQPLPRPSPFAGTSFLAAIASTAPPRPSSQRTEGLSPSRPFPMPGPSKSPNATPTAPTESTPERKGSWVLVGRTGLAGAVLEDLASSAAGYVALTDGRPLFSRDGVRWQPLEMERTAGPCPFSYGNGVWAVDAASSRDEFLLYVAELADCRDKRGATVGRSWHSGDAATWKVGFPIRTEPVWFRTWAVPGGWEALVLVPSAGVLHSWIWRTEDGLRWFAVTHVEFDALSALDVSGVGWDGTRALALRPSILVASEDGIGWEEMPTPFVDAVEITAIVAPEGVSSPWLVATHEPSPDGNLQSVPNVWLSYDLRRWEQSVFPVGSGRVDDLISTGDGYLAHVASCMNRGNHCAPQAPRQFVSDGGMEWRELPRSFEDTSEPDPVLIVDGPAGVLAIRRVDGTVWRLDESWDAERRQ